MLRARFYVRILPSKDIRTTMSGSIVKASTRFSSDVESFSANYTASAPMISGTLFRIHD